jgi:hypothetical protein
MLSVDLEAPPELQPQSPPAPAPNPFNTLALQAGHIAARIPLQGKPKDKTVLYALAC